jgi:hypothetical protein
MLSLTPPRVPPIIWKNCGIGYIKKDFFNKWLKCRENGNFKPSFPLVNISREVEEPFQVAVYWELMSNVYLRHLSRGFHSIEHDCGVVGNTIENAFTSFRSCLRQLRGIL